MEGEVIKFPERPSPEPSKGRAGTRSHLHGAAATASGLAAATGGIGGGRLVCPDQK